MYDTPYRIDTDKTNIEIVYNIMRTGEGKIATVYKATDAVKIIQALNREAAQKKAA